MIQEFVGFEEGHHLKDEHYFVDGGASLCFGVYGYGCLFEHEVVSAKFT